jgi:uncharacterized protein (TIGR04141 family)
MRNKKIALNIYLLKPKFVDAAVNLWAKEEFLNKTEIRPGKVVLIRYDEYPLGVGGQLGTLYIRKPLSETVPDWVNLVSANLANPSTATKWKNKSVSALLIRSVNDRQFAIAFGHGRHMLDPSVIEHRFGIKVALNSIEPTSISSIDRQTFDAAPKLSRTQTIKPAAVSDYGINTDQDLLRGVVGKVKPEFEKKLGSMIAGMDSLKTAVTASLHEIDAVLEAALSRSASKDYLASPDNRPSPFAWVDNLEAVSDPAMIEELDEALWDAFSSQSPDVMWLAIPEIVNWEAISGFAYTNQQWRDNELVNRLDIAGLKATLPEDASLRTLKQRVIHMVMNADGTSRPYSIYKCLYAELKNKVTHVLHILNAGNWYKVDPSFEKSVTKHFNSLPKVAFAPPFIPYNHRNEGEYNQAVCSHVFSPYKLLDRKLIHFGGGHSSIEVCDLYLANSSSAQGHLVHVKRGRDSASLSHLFAQGLVSSTLLASEPTFVKEVNKQLLKQKATVFPTKVPTAHYDVVFAIIDGDASKTLDIPFFSKVSLQNCTRSIKALGFGVALLHIPEDASFLLTINAKKASKNSAKSTGKKSPTKRTPAIATKATATK